jgi:hypothetical protein
MKTTFKKNEKNEDDLKKMKKMMTTSNFHFIASIT